VQFFENGRFLADGGKELGREVAEAVEHARTSTLLEIL
jgi:hypothetical protein